uniref:Insulin-like domain-containing protein n=1 Tax=Romanomermis culicivorax TaxID=13658 RepID=A0A915HJZ1_ROMCU
MFWLSSKFSILLVVYLHLNFFLPDFYCHGFRGSSMKKFMLKQQFGSLKLCPPGGPSFTHAWDLACDMRKKKRAFREKNSNENDRMNLVPVEISHHAMMRLKKDFDYRQATLREMMQICCGYGCEIRDLVHYCNFFS